MSGKKKKCKKSGRRKSESRAVCITRSLNKLPTRKKTFKKVEKERKRKEKERHENLFLS